MTTSSVSMKMLEPINPNPSRERRDAGPIDEDAAAHFDEAISESRSATGRRSGGTADGEGVSGEAASTSSTIDVARPIDAVASLLSQELTGLSQTVSGQAAQSEAGRAIPCGDCLPALESDAPARLVESQQHGATGAKFGGFAKTLAGMDFAALKSSRDVAEDTVAGAVGRTIALDDDPQASVSGGSAESYRQMDLQRSASLQIGTPAAWGLAGSVAASDRPAPVPVSVRRRETHFAPVSLAQAMDHERANRLSDPAVADTTGVSQRAKPDLFDEQDRKTKRTVREASRSIGTIQTHAVDIGSAASRRTSAGQLMPAQETAAVPLAQNVTGQIFDAIRQESASEGFSFMSWEQTGAASDSNPTARSAASPVRVLTLTLAPADLGNLKITLKGGAEEMQIHVEVERSDTVHQIEDERSALMDRLLAIGYKVDDIVITRMQSDAATPARENGASVAGGTGGGMPDPGHASPERSDAKGPRESNGPQVADGRDAPDAAMEAIATPRRAMFTRRVV